MSTSPHAAVDALELSVWASTVAMIAEEMGSVLVRGALSPNIRERRDASCALFDAEGRMVAQAAHIPVHLGALPEAVRAVRACGPAGAYRPHRLGECTEVHGDVRRLRDHPALGVEERTGGVAALADVRRERPAHEHAPHLLRDHRDGGGPDGELEGVDGGVR